MKYRLTVVCLQENPNFQAELDKYESKRCYSGGYPEDSYPPRTIEQRTLEVELKDIEYNAVRKAVIEAMA